MDPLTPTFDGGKKYYLIFIDNYSGKAWVYFLKEKIRFFENFWNLNKSRKQRGLHIKVLRSDHSGEYNSHEFENYCKEQGINHQSTMSYSSQ